MTCHSWTTSGRWATGNFRWVDLRYFQTSSNNQTEQILLKLVTSPIAQPNLSCRRKSIFQFWWFRIHLSYLQTFQPNPSKKTCPKKIIFRTGWPRLHQGIPRELFKELLEATGRRMALQLRETALVEWSRWRVPGELKHLKL